MADFDKIEVLLNDIVNSGYEILDAMDTEDVDLKEVRQLLKERGEKIDSLNEISLSNNTFTKPEKKKLKNLFTRYTILEKQINSIWAKLSLVSKSSLKKVALHKKAKESYKTPFKTSRFLNAQVAG